MAAYEVPLRLAGGRTAGFEDELVTPGAVLIPLVRRRDGLYRELSKFTPGGLQLGMISLHSQCSVTEMRLELNQVPRPAVIALGIAWRLAQGICLTSVPFSPMIV
jgi:hypothetical protein